MNISKITPDDPRLTAYALGELEPGEHAAVEAAIKGDPAAQAFVAQIRALGNDLAAALAKEPLPVVGPKKKSETPPAREAYQPRRFIRFPYYLLGGLAAACFALVFVHQQREATLERAQLADARVSAKREKETALATTKRHELYEIELKKDAEEARVANMPAVKSDTAISASALESLPAAAPVVVDEPPTLLAQTNSVEPKPSFTGNASGAANGIAEAKQAAAGKLADGSQGAAVAAADGIDTVSPFEVTRGAPAGYGAAKTLAGSRIGINVADVGSAVTVVRARKQPGESPSVGLPASSQPAFNTEAYAYQADNDFLDVAGNPLSTFSIDVDTTSYANMRRFLRDGQRPPRDAVRIEELVNYFPYRYAGPKDKTPFAASMEVANAPWNPAHRLVRIGLKGREISEAERPALNLVFLLDVSGSMDMPNKLPLVKDSMRLLVEKLKPTDRVAIAVYAGASGLALPSTPASKKQEILAALDALTPGGSTNGAMGIQLAYDIAKANFVEGGANRVVLCTDGDFNVGVTNQGELTRLIEEKAKSGVFLTVLGFGMGNYKDATLQKLADKGNGNYGYVDNAAEAKKLLSDQLSGTLVTIAKDVKIQVEFNPAKVKSYRLIGYEKRLLTKEDFNNDKIDAGEIGAGHTVTALYEVEPADTGASGEIPAVDPLKYQVPDKAKRVKADNSLEMLTLKIRYKAPASNVSGKLEFPLVDSGADFATASQDFKFAAAVASFGMMLRESPHKGAVTFDSVLGWAEEGTGDDAGGYRHEFMDLVKMAKACSG